MAGSGGVYIDALTQLQVDERADWSDRRSRSAWSGQPGPFGLAAGVPGRDGNGTSAAFVTPVTSASFLTPGPGT